MSPAIIPLPADFFEVLATCHVNFFTIPIASFIKPTEIGMFCRNITPDPLANVIVCNSYPRYIYRNNIFLYNCSLK